MAQGDEHMALARAGRAHQAQVLGRSDPLRGGQVVEGGLGHRGGGHLELLDGLDHGEPGAAQPGPGVGLIPRRHLGLHQRAQHFLGSPALGFGCLQDLRSGAMARTLASFKRLRPATRSGARALGAGLMPGPRCGSRSRAACPRRAGRGRGCLLRHQRWAPQGRPRGWSGHRRPGSGGRRRLAPELRAGPLVPMPPPGPRCGPARWPTWWCPPPLLP
jgi:hypothetical protein